MEGYKLDSIELVIAEFTERPLPDLTLRDVLLPEIAKKANVVVGMRRAGKTFVLFQEMQRLLASGIDKRRMLYINFEDDRLARHSPGILAETLETYFRLNPQARTAGAYLFFDEIQVVSGWSRFVRRVLDTENARVYLSGSSAKMLSTEVATEMRGRGFTVEVAPFSFTESARHHGLDLPHNLPGSRLRSQLEARFDEYLNVGGFAEVQTVDERVRLQILQDYVELVLLRDVIERHGVTNVHAARALVQALMTATGSQVSINRLYNDFKSRGIDVAKDTLYALLDYLADAFLVFEVPVFRKSLRARQAIPRKIYAIDPGLARAMSHIAAANVGARLETAVYLELRRRIGRSRAGAISYYLTAQRNEVDFVLGDADQERASELIQVCASLTATETRKRELRALDEAMNELGISKAAIVTLHQSGTEKTSAGVIKIVPAWQWMLDLAGNP